MERKIQVIKAKTDLTRRKAGKFVDRLRVAAYCRVSTGSEDQQHSYKAQVEHYTELIQQNSEWAFAGIYADEAITGTQVDVRDGFLRLINDCLEDKIDMVLTKSISRFARNTLDTLHHVRLLKEKGIAILFEEEKINTMTMDGELLLVVLSSVAQQEVENLSAHVKKSLKFKMKKGELVGFHGCLGYDYNKESKSLTVNEQEADIVRYIFRRYTEGAGGMIISRELENLGYKTKRANSKWAESTVLGIIKNEKYKGDLRMGKTFTVDPITKRRLVNLGEDDQVYISDNHEAIISKNEFEKAQQILALRSKNRATSAGPQRMKYSRQYSLSCMLECGFCGSTLSRRAWHSGTPYKKITWQCVTSTKKGKKHCPECKAVAEKIVEDAFIESCRQLSANKTEIINEMLARTKEAFTDNNIEKQIHKAKRSIVVAEKKLSFLLDGYLEELFDKNTYSLKSAEVTAELDALNKVLKQLEDAAGTETESRQRILDFQKVFEEQSPISSFDERLFETLVDKVIVGGYDENAEPDPWLLTFVFKTKTSKQLSGQNFKPVRKKKNTSKEKVSELYAQARVKADEIEQHPSDNAR